MKKINKMDFYNDQKGFDSFSISQIAFGKYGIVDGPFGSNLKSIHYRDRGIPIIQSGFVTTGKFFAEEYKYVDITKYEKEIRSSVSAGDLVIAKIGAKAGTSALLPENHPTGIIAGNCIKITPNKALICPKYLAYLMENFYQSGALKNIINTTAQPAVSMSQLKRMRILIPSLPEQKKIVDIIYCVEQLIENIQKQLSKLQNLKKGFINDLFAKDISTLSSKYKSFGIIPDRWKIGPLSEIAEMITGFAFSSSNFVKNGSLCVRMGNLYNNQFHFSRSSVYLPKTFIKQYPKFVVNSGDLLMSMTGTAGKRDYGYIVEVPDSFQKGLLNQRVAKIVPKNLNSSKFICELMRSDFYLEKLFAFGSGTKQANLSAKQILGIVVPLPPIDEQVKIGEFIETIERNISANYQRLSHYKSLKRSLTEDLISGLKRVNI
ncbi:Type I restriction-modification system [Prochlorococcus marinus str. MIT 9201]|uniref:Type I restriction-modification system n=1 Tax=Prochlorococcus marinus str. MIT 9201 TaxID=93057 RepID=A0A0A2A5D2_PROMR|nr:restriction endonuclease subunit S [Prochlorococcus marinus]KGF95613.1 Type I restriction-modification system [Prochlorococcus marinus str. MIT 9201]